MELEHYIAEIDELLKDNEWEDLKYTFAEKLYKAGQASEKNEVHEAIKTLAQITLTSHITEDMRTTATSLIEAKRQMDTSNYIRHLEQELEAAKNPNN